MLVTAACLVLFIDTAWTDMLLNKSGKLRTLPTNCVDAVRSAGSAAKSGIYQIQLPLGNWTHRHFYVYCLLDGNGGDPWLLMQRRQDGEIDFFRDWHDYKTGFGNIARSFWMGFDKLHAITQMQLHELQIELHDFNDTVKYANYETFAVGNEIEKYTLKILGKYSGSAGDGKIFYNSGKKFTTHDVDNDGYSWNCAVKYRGGWWYDNCHHSCLNGDYLNYNNKLEGKGIIWSTWQGVYYSMKYAHMAIRPKDSVEMRKNEAHKCKKRTKKG
ncbi:ficolin-1-like [Zeugodacus cucurbitae]|uniref:ficolin-1-like n=1 Tax=Zeugodacus cucurbitae TaxID=28588 RepID=UPI0023D93F6D|nr:ficolin-1-like [Zeugodacus cucurbitae]